MKNANLRKQSTAPDAPSSSVLNLYADGNNFLIQQDSNGDKRLVGTVYSGILPNTAIRTGANTAYILTGTVFGSHQGALFQTGMGTPAAWAPVIYNGTNYALPLYLLA